MKIKSLICLLFVSFLPNSYAQVYKTIDENGKVTFSSIEPTIDKNSTTKVEELDLGISHDAMTSISSNLNEKYCGKIKLPSHSENTYSSKYYIKNVTRSKKNWQASLIRLNERIAYSTQKSIKVTKSSYYDSAYKNKLNSSQRKNTESNLKQMRDLRCAINWSETQNGIISELKATKKSKNLHLLEVKTKLQSNITAQCGHEPIYDPTLKSNEAQRKRWSTCSRKKRKEIKKIDRKLRSLS